MNQSNLSLTNKTKLLGIAGENHVATFLKSQGFTILARNYTKKDGELDLVAQKKDLVVFVEVKTRAHNYFPLSAVITARKQRRVIKAAQHFIYDHNLYNKILRFDVALVIITDPAQTNASIEYIPNAFTLST
jgi:putative endonuclease